MLPNNQGDKVISWACLTPAWVSYTNTAQGRRNIHSVKAAVLGITNGVGGIELVRDGNIEVTLVLVIRFVLQHSGNNFTLFHGKDITQIEDSLFPVSVLGMRAGREADGLVACSEVDIKPGNQSVDKVVALSWKGEGGLERGVRCLDSIKVKSNDGARVADNGLHFDSVDKRLGKSNLFHWAVVEPPHIVPD